MKKNVSLNRFIATCALVICVVCVIILVFFDVILINNYQKMRRTSHAANLSNYVDKCSQDLREIAYFIDDIYVNDKNFIDLTSDVKSNAEKNEYTNVYDLDLSMRTKIRLESKISGYILYYQSGEQVRYYSNTDIISAADMKQLRVLAKEMTTIESFEGQWSFVTVNDHIYGVWMRGKGLASICAIYSISQLRTRILETVPEAKDVLCVWNGQLVGEKEHMTGYENLPGITADYDQAFQYGLKNKFIYGQCVESAPLWICMVVPVTFFTYMNIPQLLMLMFTIVCIFFIFLMYRYIRRGVIFPLQELIISMNCIRDGQWDTPLSQENQFEEIQKVGEALEVMVAEIQKQKMLSYEQTIEKQKAQMQYLQLQLKPHFYLNGLKTLNVLFMNGDAARAQDLVMRLSEHLRYLLQVERELVQLSSEIDYVKNYVQLQKDMTGRPFSVAWDVQENMGLWEVPTLCIQTFVENSFKYARLGSADCELLIRIAINELDTEDGMFLDIQIQDNGSGYPQSVLDEISEAPVEGSRMVGINNIKRRCRLLYGENAEFFFYNENGALSEMVLPMLKSVNIKEGGGMDELIDCG